MAWCSPIKRCCPASSRGCVLVVLTRAVYAVYCTLAVKGYGNISSLLGQMSVCNTYGHDCTSLAPVVNACLMSNVISIIVLLAYSAVDLALRLRAQAGCCKAPVMLTEGFKSGLGFCLLVTLMQSTASYFAVGLLVKSYQQWGEDAGQNDALILATGSIACLVAVLAVVEAAVVAIAQMRGGTTPALLSPLNTGAPNPYDPNLP